MCDAVKCDIFMLKSNYRNQGSTWALKNVSINCADLSAYSSGAIVIQQGATSRSTVNVVFIYNSYIYSIYNSSIYSIYNSSIYSIYNSSIYSIYNKLFSNVIKTFVLVIWSLVSLYVTHPNLLQPVSFALT